MHKLLQMGDDGSGLCIEFSNNFIWKETQLWNVAFQIVNEMCFYKAAHKSYALLFIYVQQSKLHFVVKRNKGCLDISNYFSMWNMLC